MFCELLCSVTEQSNDVTFMVKNKRSNLICIAGNSVKAGIRVGIKPKTLVKEDKIIIEEALKNAKSVAKEVKTKFELTDHSKTQMIRREIKEPDLDIVMKNKPFDYFYDGEWKGGFYDVGKFFLLLDQKSVI